MLATSTRKHAHDVVAMHQAVKSITDELCNLTVVETYVDSPAFDVDTNDFQGKVGVLGQSAYQQPRTIPLSG